MTLNSRNRILTEDDYNLNNKQFFNRGELVIKGQDTASKKSLNEGNQILDSSIKIGEEAKHAGEGHIG
jgi:pSer/pThr/pTyr-binding forkhead associated (FHA) protein